MKSNLPSLEQHEQPEGLSIEHLCKTYENGHVAVKDLTLSIAPGEFIVLVGPSGCGKSSILRSIAGLERLSGGEIYLGERRIDNKKPAERDIAMVFQNYALYPHMTVYDNLAYGLKNRGINKHVIREKIHDVAKILKIEDYLQRKPAKLSGGQRQRVAMGRAIVRDPQLFLFDEPLSNLDASLRAHMRLEIKKIQQSLNVTSVYVTHDQVEAMTLADRIVVLNQGRIEQVGTPSEIYHQPATQFVASFMGSPAMNFLPATLDSGHLNCAGVQVFLPEYRHLDQTNVTLGIRPEHVCAPDGSDTLHMPMQVSVVETLGANQLVHGNVHQHLFTAVTPELSLNPLVPLPLHIDKSHLHLFDANGDRLMPVFSDEPSLTNAPFADSFDPSPFSTPTGLTEEHAMA